MWDGLKSWPSLTVSMIPGQNQQGQQAAGGPPVAPPRGPSNHSYDIFKVLFSKFYFNPLIQLICFTKTHGHY